MKYILTIFIFILIYIGVSAQNKNNPKPMTAQDSAMAKQAEENKFFDSLFSKTSLKDFQTFLYETVTGKAYSEWTFIQLFNLFADVKYREWLQRRQKKP